MSVMYATFSKDQVVRLLGKRSRKDDIETWAPGVGLGPQSNESEAARRTSLLFLQLQQTVNEAVAWRHNRDTKSRKVSADIAARCPLVFSDESPKRHAEEDVTVTVAKVKAPVVSFEEMMKAAALETKAKMIAARSLPAPLTQAALNEAYTQLPSGAEQSIESVISFWRSHKMTADDVIATVKSFAGSSESLQKIFAADLIEGEVASDEQMRELSRLAMCV